MAIVKSPSSNFGPPEEFGLKDAPAAPVGQWLATCIGVCDQLGVVLPKYENPAETEKQDRVCFLFGFRDGAGNAHKVASRWMKISGHPKAKLMDFLSQAMGQPFPIGKDYNVDVAEGGMKGRKVLMSVQNVAREGGGTYATIMSIVPVPAGYVQPATQPAPQVAPAPAPAKQTAEIPF